MKVRVTFRYEIGGRVVEKSAEAEFAEEITAYQPAIAAAEMAKALFTECVASPTSDFLLDTKP